MQINSSGQVSLTDPDLLVRSYNAQFAGYPQMEVNGNPKYMAGKFKDVKLTVSFPGNGVGKSNRKISVKHSPLKIGKSFQIHRNRNTHFPIAMPAFSAFLFSIPPFLFVHVWQKENRKIGRH